MTCLFSVLAVFESISFISCQPVPCLYQLSSFISFFKLWLPVSFLRHLNFWYKLSSFLCKLSTRLFPLSAVNLYLSSPTLWSAVSPPYQLSLGYQLSTCYFPLWAVICHFLLQVVHMSFSFINCPSVSFVSHIVIICLFSLPAIHLSLFFKSCNLSLFCASCTHVSFLYQVSNCLFH
jgi:hypothetical protein